MFSSQLILIHELATSVYIFSAHSLLIVISTPASAPCISFVPNKILDFLIT